MGNFYYSIGKIWQTFDNLSDARNHMKYIIKQDRNTNALNRDNKGRYYIVRGDIRSGRTRRYPL